LVKEGAAITHGLVSQAEPASKSNARLASVDLIHSHKGTQP
jgi:hypothetical protein